MSTDQQQPSSNLDKKVPWLFFFDIISQQLGIQVTLQFMNMFMTNFLLMSAAATAAILSVGRIIDLLVSTVSGTIVQKGNLKAGPLRFYILINGPLLLIGNICIFLNPSVGDTAKYVVFIIGYLFRNLPQSFLITASNALVPKVAGSNLNDRLALTAKKAQATQTAAIFTSMATVPLVQFFEGSMGPGKGYLITAIIYCVIHSIIGFLVYRGLAPYDQYDPDAKKVEGSAANVKVAHIYSDTLKNPQAWILTLAALLAQIGMFTLQPMNAYYNIYVLGSLSYMAITNSVIAYAALGVAIIVPPFVKKIGKKNSYVLAFGGQAIGFAGMLFLSRGKYPIFLAFQIWNRCMMGLSTAVGVNIWADAAEYQLYKTGRDSRPFIMSLQSLMMKVGQFISSFTYAILINYTNFKALGGGQAELDATKLHNGLYGYLLVTYILITLLYMSFGINEEKSKEYTEANKKMMDERAAAAGLAPTK
ncbi:MAG: MFS transporter [Eubacteriaceae bacterium]|nr:MFS transporter [Eubacteriaceae bacterium]